MNRTRTLKLGTTLLLVTVLSVAMVAVAQSYALPSQAKKQGDRDDDDDHPKGLAVGQEKRDVKKAELEEVPEKHHKRTLGMSSVIIAKDSTVGKESITILTKGLKKVTLNVSGAKIVKNGGTDTNYLTMFSRLAVGDHALVRYRDVGGVKNATLIDARTPSQLKAAGNVTAKTSDSITIQARSGESITLKVVTASTSPLYTVIKKGGETAGFGDINLRDHVKTTFIVQPDGTLSAITIRIAVED